MILTPHLLSGAAAAAIINSLPISTEVKYLIIVPIAIILHHTLDSIPHWEYNILKNKKKAVLKIFTDLSAGSFLLVILIFNLPRTTINIISFGTFFALLPDGLLLLSMIFNYKPYQKFHSMFHNKKEYGFKKGSVSQILVVIIFLFILYFSA